MLKIHEIREIIKLLDQSNINEFELENNGTKISIKKGAAQPVVYETPVRQAQPQAAPLYLQAAPAASEQTIERDVLPSGGAAPQQAAQAEDTQLHKVVSPMVGTFYSRPEPDAPNYVKVGDRIKSDTIVCIVEAMKLFNEIEAEVSGEIVKILVEDGQLVEYGQPLFLVKPE